MSTLPDIVAGKGGENPPARPGHLRVLRPHGGSAEAVARRPRVLAVDDEPANLDYIRRCLRKSYEVVTAQSPEQALSLLAADNWDIIISDQRMPGMNGAQFLTRSLDTTPGSIRIIITAFSDLDATIDAINRARIAGFVRKPFSETDLLRIISGAEDGRAASGDAAQTRFRAVLDSMPDGVAVCGDDGRVQWSNAQLGQMIGCHPETLVPRLFTELLHADDREAFAKPSGEVLARLLRNDGTSVRVSIARSPIAGASAEVVRLRPLTAAATRVESGGRGRVLIVDNETRILRALKRALAPHCDVTVARSAKEALAAVEANRHFDLVLCDLFLDNYTGLELHEQLAARDPSIAARFVVMTAGPDSVTDVPCLYKPFAIADVLELLGKSASAAG